MRILKTGTECVCSSYEETATPGEDRRANEAEQRRRRVTQQVRLSQPGSQRTWTWRTLSRAPCVDGGGRLLSPHIRVEELEH